MARRTTRAWTAPVAGLRKAHGLPPGRDPVFEGQHSPQLVLALFSRLLGQPQPDWPPNVVVTGAMLSLDVAVLWRLRMGSVPFGLSLFALLLSALLYSTASALLISLLARDFRAANQLGGALLGPTTVLGVAVLGYGPPGAGSVLLLSAMFLVAAGVAVYVALRVLTFERLLR